MLADVPFTEGIPVTGLASEGRRGMLCFCEISILRYISRDNFYGSILEYRAEREGCRRHSYTVKTKYPFWGMLLLHPLWM